MPDLSIFDLFRQLNQTTPITVIDGEPFLLVGLGNPGKEYQNNRHNIGFMALDRIAKEYGIEQKKVKSKAIVLEGRYQQKRVILIKPQTYMNLSGEAVASLARFYKINPDRVLVMHDDLDLPFGTIRLRPGGGPGGQKGIASIIDRLGTQQFPRVRIGIGRPPGRMQAADYVLQDFSKGEKEELEFILGSVVKAVNVFLVDGMDGAMNQYNGTVQKDE
ncbi:MAG: aminoacyl-tRNA hydrolase [Chloroflexi bacterium HGW-Chloroflexi-10]|nr:MAG: aminoacyl-tRNA hydrolase [Chloroflexi bacterium HGW-Chloroflexi-10]